MIERSALKTDADFGSFDTRELTEAWRQAHFAAQVAAEVGKSWALEKPDDSQSSFSWVRTRDWRGLEGMPTPGTTPCHARLRFETLELSVDDARGRTAATLSLSGLTLDQAMDWVSSACLRVLGPRRQPSRPAPDLPDHPVAHGEPFHVLPNGLRILADLYDGTARMLAKLVGEVRAFEEPRCWPHHFDLASLAVFDTDDGGAVIKSIGVGITPPDSVESSGYWYVSPWVKDGGSVSPEDRQLSVGLWSDRGAGGAMAILPISVLSTSHDPPANLAAFVAEAFNACAEVLGV